MVRTVIDMIWYQQKDCFSPNKTIQENFKNSKGHPCPPDKADHSTENCVNFHFCGRIPFDNLQHYFIEGISFFNAIPYTIFIITGLQSKLFKTKNFEE